MEPNIISRDTLLAARRKADIEVPVQYEIGGERREVTKRIVAGEMELIDVGDRPFGELLTTPAGLDTLVQKSVLDLELGREQVPLLYQPIYRRRENRRFTKTVQVGSAATRAHAVFLEHLEGEEVKFGTRTIGPTDSVPILTYASAFQWTEDMEEFDLSWEPEEAQRATGEAYNALLNHLHLYPIISYSYAAGNIQTYNPDGLTSSVYEKDRSTLEAALRKAALTKDAETGMGIMPSIILAHSSNRFRITDALQQRQIGGTIYQPVGQQLTTVILYDGWSVTVGEKTYTYGGVPTDKIFLVEPQRRFHELVKHDLIVTADNADISRLINQQIVARARRGVYAAPSKAVMVMELS